MTRDWLIATGLFLLALGLNLGAVEQSPLHPDETRWLHRAHYLRNLTDPFGPTWRDGYLTRGQPPLGSYLMGAGLVVQGRDLETNGVWEFRHDEALNRARGNMASPADLAAGRRTNAVVGALAVAVVYLAGALLTNRIGGVAGALLLATHPLMLLLSSQALSDALLVLCLAVALLAGCRLGTRPDWRSAFVLGIALGLGGATKLSPLLLSLPLAGLGLV
ncbi:MAG: glycosyltransferase family 39 protein, partial [Dehalococcoidia bacterium]